MKYRRDDAVLTYNVGRVMRGRIHTHNIGKLYRVAVVVFEDGGGSEGMRRGGGNLGKGLFVSHMWFGRHY